MTYNLEIFEEFYGLNMLCLLLSWRCVMDGFLMLFVEFSMLLVGMKIVIIKKKI